MESNLNVTVDDDDDDDYATSRVIGEENVFQSMILF